MVCPVGLIKNSVTPQSTVNGQSLSLKGGDGSIAVVSLFGSGEIDRLRNEKAIINDASLYFTVESVTKNPLRMYLYDLDTDKLIADYSLDGSTNLSNTLLNKSVFGGILSDINLEGVSKKRYRIRITNHISRIINSPNTPVKYENVRLGLVITENINNPALASLKNSFTLPAVSGLTEKTVIYTPVGSVMSPMSVKLYGTGSGADNIKFKIHYTKP